MSNERKKGFTLIELLVVIVIIIILAGVLVAVINPQAIQNRAKDGVTVATLNKLALTGHSFVSSYSRAGNEEDFFASIGAAKTQFNSYSCTVIFDPDYECVFELTGKELPTTCDLTGGWTGNVPLDPDDLVVFDFKNPFDFTRTAFATKLFGSRSTPGWFHHITGNKKCKQAYFQKGQKPNAEWEPGKCNSKDDDGGKGDGGEGEDTCEPNCEVVVSYEGHKCHYRYYAGPDLPGNTSGDLTKFRIYAKSARRLNEMYVYDSENSGIIFVCPWDLQDSDDISLCTRI